MSKTVLIVAASVTAALVCFVIMCFVLYGSAKNKERIELRQREESSITHDHVVNSELEDYKILENSLFLEAKACDRLHLSKEEKSKRLDAVDKAGRAEMERVRSSGFTSTFHPPSTD